MAQAKAPQLVYEHGVPIWRATRAAIKAEFPTKRANLKYFADNEAALVARCHRLTAEQNEWLSGRRKREVEFNGTIRSVINLWQTDATSPYQRLEASSRHPYDIYARMIVETVGARRVDAEGVRPVLSDIAVEAGRALAREINHPAAKVSAVFNTIMAMRAAARRGLPFSVRGADHSACQRFRSRMSRCRRSRATSSCR